MLKKRTLLNKLLYLNPLYRGLALFFVLFTFLDIALPQLCDEELLSFSSSTMESSSSTSTESSSSTPTVLDSKFVITINTNQESDQLPSTRDDDCCFCCCSHWLPVKTFNMDITEEVLSQRQPHKVSLPDSPPHNAYHPPRSI